MEHKVGIILINYQDYAKRFLADCRDSLRKTRYPADRFTVYLVDNASTGESERYIRMEYPEAVVLPSRENEGWGGGNNIGMQRAFADGCEAVALLNMDTVVESDWLHELVRAAESDPNIGIVQSKLLLYSSKTDATARINSLGNELHFLGFGFCRGYGEIESNYQLQAPSYQLSDIPYASGSALYIKREVIQKTGWFNPEFFMYHDDIEICLKARLCGYRVVLAPASRVWHKYEFKRSIRQVYCMERNRLLTVLEFYKAPTLFLLAPAFALMEAGLFFASLAGGYARAQWKSRWYFFLPSSWRKLLAERRRIRGLRTISDRAFLKLCTGTIDFQEVQNPLLRRVVNPIFNAYWRIAQRLIFW